MRATGPPGHPKFFKGSDFWFFFHFSADGLRGEEKKELYFLFSFYTVDRRPKNEKNEKSEPLKNFGWPGGPVARTAGHAKIFQRFARRKQRGHKGPQAGHNGPQGATCGPQRAIPGHAWPPCSSLAAPLFATGGPLKNFRVVHRSTTSGYGWRNT